MTIFEAGLFLIGLVVVTLFAMIKVKVNITIHNDGKPLWQWPKKSD